MSMAEHYTNHQSQAFSSMSKQPYFSVVIPVFNKKKEIIRCLESCSSQAFLNFEVIVIDDGSTDGSGELARQFQDERVSVWSIENSGQGAARNYGSSKANGRYVAFLDADDTWASNHLLELNLLTTRHPFADAASTMFAYMKDGRVKSTKLDNLIIDDDVLVNYLEVTAEKTSPIHTNSICIRKEKFQELGGFDKSLPLAQDIDLWIRLYCTSDILYSMKVTSFYHIDSSNMVTKSSDRTVKYLLFIDKLSIYLADRKYSEYWDRLKTNRNGFLLSLAYTAAVEHDSKARNHIILIYPYYWHFSIEFIYWVSFFRSSSKVMILFLKILRKIKRQIR
jgi:glycosyltransferase involved in cell wall biosynthesis